MEDLFEFEESCLLKIAVLTIGRFTANVAADIFKAAFFSLFLEEGRGGMLVGLEKRTVLALFPGEEERCGVGTGVE